MHYQGSHQAKRVHRFAIAPKRERCEDHECTRMHQIKVIELTVQSEQTKMQLANGLHRGDKALMLESTSVQYLGAGRSINNVLKRRDGPFRGSNTCV